MASARFTSMGGRPTNLKTEQFDMDSFFDFSQSSAQPSPATATSSRSDATPKTASQDWNALSPFDQNEERQRFNGPSHDYNQYRQQVGLPVGSTASIPMHNMYDGYDSGIGEMGFDSGFNGWSTGIDIDADVNMDFNNPQSAMPAMFFPQASNDTPSDAFIDPNALGGQEPTSNVGRLWPGMHSQQAQHAAMQKAAHTSALQQRQQKLQAQHAQYRQAASGPQNQVASQQGNGHAKRPSHVSEPHVEESISRLLNQMRHNSAVSNGDDADDDDDDMLPHIARMKKDEEDMDEDERLLASDEGKKLSSKERRQLRNKVSARAFRSRRKEYIGQLEGEVALKTQEATDLRNQNQALHHENDRYRGLIETLLRHPAFTPFINDISKDPSVLGPPPQQQPQSQQQQQHRQPATPAQQHSQPQQQPSQQQQQQQQQQRQQQQEARPEFMNFDASQLQLPQQQNERVGLATIPETDFSKLNINGFNAMNFNSFQSVNAFAVREVPKGPDPLDLLAASSLYSTHSASARAALDFANTTSDSATCEYDMNILLAKLDRAAQSMQLRGT